jgi:glucan phosphoethanolaminetransferase (alkaline phosphatase superfamily)
MQELNQMLTIAGGVIIAGAIALVFSIGWRLTTASDRYSSRWVQRLFGVLILIATLAASFWIVFIRTGVPSWGDVAHLLPPH